MSRDELVSMLQQLPVNGSLEVKLKSELSIHEHHTVRAVRVEHVNGTPVITVCDVFESEPELVIDAQIYNTVRRMYI